MRAELSLQRLGRGARLIVLFGMLSWTGATSGCVCAPTEDQECEDEEELYAASGWVTINGMRTAGVWIVPSRGDSLRTNLAGEFFFDLPLTGTTLTARPPAGAAFLRAQQSVTLSKRDSIRFEGYRVATVSGHVRFNGQPVPGVVLELNGPVTLVDTAGPDGAYRFTAVPPEPRIGYRLRIAAGPPGIHHATEIFTVAGVDVVRDFDVSFPSGGNLRGTVGAGGNGLRGVIVTVTGAFTLTDTTAADGTWSSQKLPPGDYTVSIAGFDASAYSFPQTSRVVALHAGSQTQVDFSGTEIRPNEPPAPVITQPAEGAVFVQGTAITFTGAATDPEDGALTGASLAWTVGAGTPLGTGATVTTSTLSALPHRIWLTATDSQGRSAATSILITVIESSQPGSISGRVTANGYGVGGATVTLSGAASATAVTDGNASYSFPNLLPGTYTVSISGYPSAISFPATSQTVTLAGGQNLVVNFAGSY
jgi:hypothetical protein